jgi:hypothetical protein
MELEKERKRRKFESWLRVKEKGEERAQSSVSKYMEKLQQKEVYIKKSLELRK